MNASSWKPITATALNSVYPPLIALQAAVRSAQIVGLYAEFSILQPPVMLPSLNRMAAPTLKLLYGLNQNNRNQTFKPNKPINFLAALHFLTSLTRKQIFELQSLR